MLWTPFPFLWVSQVGGPPDTRFTSTTSVASNNNPANAGTSITFTATITTTGTPTGTVTFFDGATSIGTGAVSAGVATLTTSALSVGTHSIVAIYGGDATHQPSASSALSQVVNIIITSIVMTASPEPSAAGASVTLTATVTPSSATGTVTFTDLTSSAASMLVGNPGDNLTTDAGNRLTAS